MHTIQASLCVIIHCKGTTLAGRQSVLHADGQQSQRCEILGLNFSPERMVGSHALTQLLTVPMVESWGFGAGGKHLVQNQYFLLALEGLFQNRRVHATGKKKGNLYFPMANKQDNELCVGR